MSSQRTFTSEFKAKIAVEILSEKNTISEIGARENISPKQLGNWKREFLGNAYRAFSVTKDEKTAKESERAAREREQELMAKIGQLTYECDWLKKNMDKLEVSQKAAILDDDPKLSIRRQCELIGYNRSNYYYSPPPRVSGSLEYKEAIMQRLDYWNTEEPAWGVKMLVPLLENEGYKVSGEFVRELRAERGLKLFIQKRIIHKVQKARKLPYLLRCMRANDMIWLPNLVWAIDVTYIKMGRGHMYLVAIIDGKSRFIVGQELSDSLETALVLDSVKQSTKESDRVWREEEGGLIML